VSSAGESGAEIVAVAPGSAADEAGLEVGDRITAIDSAPVTTPEDLVGVIASRQPDEQVEVTVVRSGRSRQIAVTLGAHDETPA